MATPSQDDKLWLVIQKKESERDAVAQKLENAKGDEKQLWLEFMLGHKKTLDEELLLLYGKLSVGTGMLEVRMCMGFLAHAFARLCVFLCGTLPVF
jgi:hypothetical protein